MSVKLICVSHTPLMDFSKPPEDVEKRARDALAKLADDVKAYQPDMMIMFGPDHFNGFFYDIMPPACVGLRASAAGDWDMGPGAISTAEAEGLRLVSHLLNENVGITYSYRMTADHGITQPLYFLTGGFTNYPVIPIFINSAATPLAPVKFSALLGQKIGEFIKANMADKKVLIIGSGGLSHDPPTPQFGQVSPEVDEFLTAGRNPSVEARASRQEKVKAVGMAMTKGESNALPLNQAWDKGLLESFAHGDMTRFHQMQDDEINRLGGKGGHEIRCWVAACAAMQAVAPYTAEIRYYEPIKEWIAGFGALIADSQ